MPRFYFQVDDGAELRDVVGIELPSLGAARAEAARYAAKLLADAGDAVWACEAWTVTVTDDIGAIRFTMTLSI